MSRYKTKRTGGKRVSLHRWLMEQHIGRKLLINEYVHHINHDKKDNRIENLCIETPQAHAEHHNQKHPKSKLCAICGETFAPHPTKRVRAQTCSRKCMRELMSRRAFERYSRARAESPPLAEAIGRAVLSALRKRGSNE